MNLTVEDVSRLFSVSEKTIQRWIRTRGLPACRVLHQYRFNRTDLLEWASANQVDVAPGLADAEGRPAATAPSLADALEAGGIHFGVGGDDKPTVLAQVVGLLNLPGDVDRARLLVVLLAREEMGSTAIGEGIAIPHARDPIVLSVGIPTVTLCYLDRPIDFAALDGRPVNILFTLISPTVPAHLSLLSRLVFVLRDPMFRKLLFHKASGAEILAGVRSVEAAMKTTAPAEAEES